MRGNENAPVIIKKRIIVQGGGHHGGAWKVAYADFVTAMMAFFMLMWLLNATTEKQRKGLADYFNPTIPVNRISGGGDGMFNGNSVFTEETLVRNGTGGVSTTEGASGAEADNTSFDGVEESLRARGGESMATEMTLRHIVTRVTDQGLIIDIHDLPDRPLFLNGTTQPAPVLLDLVSIVVEVISLTSNPVAVGGHVQSQPIVLRENPNWALSSARAHAVRTLMEGEGLRPERVQRVTGFADRTPSIQPPISIENNRIEVILLRQKL